MKTCSKCRVTQPMENFNKKCTARDGRHSNCKACRLAQRKPVRAELSARESARYHAKSSEVNAARRLAYAADPTEVLARNQKWRAANPSKMREAGVRYRSKKVGACHEPYSRNEIFSRWGGGCCYCDEPATALDHVTPISKGGADAAWNLVPSCQRCNSSKSSKSLAEWASTF